MTKYTIDIDVPEGWKPVAYRAPVKDVDHVLDVKGVVLCYWDGAYPYIIIERIEPETVMVEMPTETAKILASSANTLLSPIARAALERAGVKWE